MCRISSHRFNTAMLSSTVYRQLFSSQMILFVSIIISSYCTIIIQGHPLDQIEHSRTKIITRSRVARDDKASAMFRARLMAHVANNSGARPTRNIAHAELEEYHRNQIKDYILRMTNQTGRQLGISDLTRNKLGEEFQRRLQNSETVHPTTTTQGSFVLQNGNDGKTSDNKKNTHRTFDDMKEDHFNMNRPRDEGYKDKYEVTTMSYSTRRQESTKREIIYIAEDTPDWRSGVVQFKLGYIGDPNQIQVDSATVMVLIRHNGAKPRHKSRGSRVKRASSSENDEDESSDDYETDVLPVNSSVTINSHGVESQSLEDSVAADKSENHDMKQRDIRDESVVGNSTNLADKASDEKTDRRVTRRRVTLFVYMDNPEKNSRGKDGEEFQNDSPVEESEQRWLARLTVLVRHTKWFRILLPTAAVQDVLRSQNQTLRIRIECVECDDTIKLVTRTKQNRRKAERKQNDRKINTGVNDEIVSSRYKRSVEKTDVKQKEGRQARVDHIQWTVSDYLQRERTRMRLHHQQLKNVPKENFPRESHNDQEQNLLRQSQRQKKNRRKLKRKEEKRLTRGSSRRPVLVLYTSKLT